MVRYQVFISSTVKDLKKEREAVRKALLEKHCFPASMEDFPAQDIEQFDYIKSVIDESDYYILILGGHLGSIASETGKSYTEMEYDYAVINKKPIIVFAKQDARDEFVCYEKGERQMQYMEFRNKAIRNRLCRKFKRCEELVGMVHQSMNTMIKKYPQLGWKKQENISFNNDEKLLLSGRIIDFFLIGKEIYEVKDKFYYLSTGTVNNKISIKYGIDNDACFKLMIFYKDNLINIYSMLSKSLGEQYCNDKTNFYQISIAKLGNYDENLLFISVGNKRNEMLTYIYKYGDVGFKQIGKIQGQCKMVVDYDLMVLIGDMGSCDRYCYVKNNIFQMYSLQNQSEHI